MTKSLDDVDKSLGRRLCEERRSRGLSQEQLAEKLQIDPRDIRAYESGAKRVSAERLLRIAKVLGVGPVEFFRFSDGQQRDAGEDDKRPSGGGGAYLTLVEEGLALHQAFASIKAAPLRRAIVALAVEYAKTEIVE